MPPEIEIPHALQIAFQHVEDMTEAAPFAGTIAGFGQGGFLEVSDRVKGIGYFLNMKWITANKRAARRNTYMNEFVWDPINLRFCTLSASGMLDNGNGSPHQGLARAIDADESWVCGGTILRPSAEDAQATLKTKGILHVTEFSGHFGHHWTDKIRNQFSRYMQFRTGLIIKNDGYNADLVVTP